MENLLSLPVIAWLLLAVVLGIIEVLTPGAFFFILFAVAAIAAAVGAYFAPSAILAQALLFLAVSVIMLVFARPLLRSMLNISDKPAKDSNAAALINADVLVLEEVDKYKGRVKVVHNGEVWTAYLFEPAEGETLPEGQEGLIVKIDGAKLAIRRKA